MRGGSLPRGDSREVWRIHVRGRSACGAGRHRAGGLGDRHVYGATAGEHVGTDRGVGQHVGGAVHPDDRVGSEEVGDGTPARRVLGAEVDLPAVTRELHDRVTGRDRVVKGATRGRGEHRAERIPARDDQPRAAGQERRRDRPAVGSARATLDEEHPLAGEQSPVDDGGVGTGVGARVDPGGDADAAGAGLAGGAAIAAGAAVVDVGLEAYLAAVAHHAVAVAEARVAGDVPAAAEAAGHPHRIGSVGANIAAGPAVAEVEGEVAAHTTAEGLARGAGGGTHPRRAGLARGADVPAGAAVARVREDVRAGVPTRPLTRGAAQAIAGAAGLVRVAPPAAGAAVAVVAGEVDADRAGG